MAHKMFFFLYFIRNLSATVSEGHLDEAPRSSNYGTRDPVFDDYVCHVMKKFKSDVEERRFMEALEKYDSDVAESEIPPEHYLNEVLENSDIVKPNISEHYLDRVPKTYDSDLESQRDHRCELQFGNNNVLKKPGWYRCPSSDNHTKLIMFIYALHRFRIFSDWEPGLLYEDYSEFVIEDMEKYGSEEDGWIVVPEFKGLKSLNSTLRANKPLDDCLWVEIFINSPLSIIKDKWMFLCFFEIFNFIMNHELICRANYMNASEYQRVRAVFGSYGNYRVMTGFFTKLYSYNVYGHKVIENYLWPPDIFDPHKYE